MIFRSVFFGAFTAATLMTANAADQVVCPPPPKSGYEQYYDPSAGWKYREKKDIAPSPQQIIAPSPQENQPPQKNELAVYFLKIVNVLCCIVAM